MRRSLLRMLLLALAAGLQSAPSIAACTMERYAELPITMSGLRPTLAAAVNGSEQTFLADSGAFFSVISPGTAHDLGLKLVASPYLTTIGGVGGESEIKVATVKAFTIAGTTIPNVQFIVGGSEPGTAGLIGQNVLGSFDAEYDLPHGAIRLMRTKGCEKTNLAYWTKSGEAYSLMDIDRLETSGDHIAGSVTINDAKVRAVFDTGAGASILSLAAAARAGLKPDMPGAEPAGFERGLGRKTIRTWIVPVKRMKIGDEQIQNARVRIGDLGIDVDMLIGADFFISHRLFVSNALHKLFFSYTGGPIFDLTAHAAGDTARPDAAPAAEPSLDAAGLSRRAAVEAAQHQTQRAIADLSRAIALAPGEPRYLLQRAPLYFESDQDARGAADIDQAIKLKSDDVAARMRRAALRLEAKNKAGAIEDLDVAAAAAGSAADQRLAMATLYSEAGAFEKSIAQSTLWIANHPSDSRRPQALNGRCWARGLGNRELPAALDDCNAALRLDPRRAIFLDSRALVRLRMGDRDKALADYDAALATNPKIAWSLFGRSIIEKANGKAQAAKTDRDAALAIDPELPALARQYGIDE